MDSAQHTSSSGGISQPGRLLQEIDPSWFPVDGRTRAQLLKQTVLLAPGIRYYDFHDSPDGSWESFFDGSIDVLTSLISESDLSNYITRFEQLMTVITHGRKAEGFTHAISEALAVCADLLSLLLKFRDCLSLAPNQYAGLADLFHIVDDIGEEEINYIGAVRGAETFFSGIVRPVVATDVFSRHPHDAVPQLVAGGDNAKISFVRTKLNSLFSSLKVRYGRLVSASDTAVARYKSGDNDVEAHLALFFTFLQLFAQLQRSTNQLTERHLQYYYDTVLGMDRLPASADSTHVVIELQPAAGPLRLKAGEPLTTGSAGQIQDELFLLDHDIEITHAVVRQLLTSFMTPASNDMASLPTGAGDKRLYFGRYEAPVVSDFVKSPKERSWTLLGEDQAGLPLRERNMEAATTGLMVGSPLLYLRDGERHIHIRFQITMASSEAVRQYVDHTRGSHDEKSFTHKLLQNAFTVSITGDAGWLEIPHYAVSWDFKSNLDNYIELALILSPADKPVGPFVAALHGENGTINTAAIRLLVNNNSFHGPLGFLMGIQLTRVTLRIDVYGSQQFTLKNNIGPISTTIPFQPFGPTPEVGSYLDITSPTIFNRFTKRFKIHLDWLGLPRDAGGFGEYYRAYQNDIHNDSFRVSLATVVDGHVNAPAAGSKDYLLFETRRDNDLQVYLKEHSHW